MTAPGRGWTTTHPSEDAAARLARLRPYSMRALIADMGDNSGALELDRDLRTIGEVEAVQVDNPAPKGALIVLVAADAHRRRRSDPKARKCRARLEQTTGGWKVNKVLVP